MSENAGTLKPDQLLEIIARQRWLLIIPFCISMVIGSILAIFLPKAYEASTLILIEAQRVPSDYVQSIVSIDINSRINTISQQILSRTNLEKVIHQLNLFSDPENEKMLLIDKIEKMRENIDIQVTKSGGRRSGPDSFRISYGGKSPENVMNVVNTLASEFINENLKVREEQATGTSDFLEGELFTMRKKLEEVEEIMKNYRRKYMGELPEQLESNLRILDRLQAQLIDRQTRLSEAKNQLSHLTHTVNAPEDASLGPGEASDLNQLNEQLKELMTKYTDRHPDIVRLKKTITALQEEMKKQETQKGVQPFRILSLREKQAIFESKQEIKTLSKELDELQEQISQYKFRVENTPKREQELMTLRRDYQNIQESYSSLLRRKLEAEIAVNMEKKQKGERFRILDYAQIPEKPASPDMKKLFLMLIAAGLGLGGGIVFLLEYSDSSFRRSDDIESFLGLPVLAEIPSITHPEDLRKQKLHYFITVISLCISAILFICFFSVTLIGYEKLYAFLDNLRQ